MRFEGIYTPIVTPYRDDHSIDRDRFAEVAEHLIAAGLHGIIVAGTTGEYYAQTAEERAADPETQRWWKETDPCQVPLPDAAAQGKIWADMTEVYHLP